MGNREKRNKKQKHTETFAHVWLWNIEKKLKRKSPYIEDKKKKKSSETLDFLWLSWKTVREILIT